MTLAVRQEGFGGFASIAVRAAIPGIRHPARSRAVEVTPEVGINTRTSLSPETLMPRPTALSTCAAAAATAVRGLLASSVVLGFAGTASAHHGFGNFDRNTEVVLKGTVKGLDFVNPHAYVYFEVAAADGAKTAVPLRDARRHRAAPLGLVAGDVQARRADRDHRARPTASTRIRAT